jgi:hypothetical protein
VLALGIPAAFVTTLPNGTSSISVKDSNRAIARIFLFIFPFSLIYFDEYNVAVFSYLTIMEQGSTAFFYRVKQAFNVRDTINHCESIPNRQRYKYLLSSLFNEEKRNGIRHVHLEKMPFGDTDHSGRLSARVRSFYAIHSCAEGNALREVTEGDCRDP